MLRRIPHSGTLKQLKHGAIKIKQEMWGDSSVGDLASADHRRMCIVGGILLVLYFVLYSSN